MPFNYTPQTPQYMALDKGVLEGASKSPFEIAGKAMTQLDEAIDNRAFERDISSVNDLQGLSGLTATTPKQQALMASKQGMFSALDKQNQFQQTFGLSQDTLGETSRHNKMTELASLNKADKGFGVSTDPITGQTRVYSKDTGLFGGTSGGIGTEASDSGEPISSKTATVTLPDGTTVYTNRAGVPLTRGGEPIVKERTKFNLEMPSNIAQEQSTADAITKMVQNVKDNPKAVGSLGSGAFNFVANNINDMLKVPTDTRLARNQITATAGVLAANIRSMYEKGVMTEPDFERYKKLVPNENDSKEEFIYKATTLQKELQKSAESKAKMQGTKSPDISEIDVNKSPSQVIKLGGNSPYGKVTAVEGDYYEAGGRVYKVGE